MKIDKTFISALGKRISRVYHSVLVFLHLSPLSLAEKCRITFGLAVIATLILALSIPYIWMGQLTKNDSLNSGRAKSETLLQNHFEINPGQTTLPKLDSSGLVGDPNDSETIWIRFTKETDKQIQNLTKKQKNMIDSLRDDSDRDDDIVWVNKENLRYSNYVRIIRASDNCISCHNPEGSATAYGRNEPIGAVIIQKPAGQFGKTILMNTLWVLVAFLIAGTGAIVAFYMITQRVILRPIRQLRALANNVAEGNLDIRSSIKTRDEYEKLSDAFNHMLDQLQEGQQKLRLANKQLDAKIAELSERNIELFKANKIKGEFLANMSHEFRTPLNAILGFAEIIREKPVLLKKEKGQRYAENIITSGNRLLNMINDLLDLAKTEAGKMKLHVEKTSLPELCKATVRHFSSLTKREKIKVKLQVDRNIPTLLTDAGKVQQILYNFLSNAVKFTPPNGKIEITAAMTDDRHVRISVSDTGCGIADGDKKKIFEKFRQADGSITRRNTGSGLGLAISTELAAMFAGAIGLESELNKGSTFWLDIPVTITKETEEGSKKEDEQNENQSEHDTPASY